MEVERPNKAYAKTMMETVVMYNFLIKGKVTYMWELFSALSIDNEAAKILVLLTDFLECRLSQCL
jgi:hypothetical protein